MAGENLLVVDDNATVLRVVKTALSRAGFRVDTAKDVPSGMALARANRPAVILVDSLIPGRPADGPGSAGGPSDRPTGGALMCGALAAEPTLARTPVVLMTAKGEDLAARYARASNIIDYISKPFSPDAVLAIVNSAIEKSVSDSGPTAVTELSELPPDHAEPAATGDNAPPADGAPPHGGAAMADRSAVAEALARSAAADPQGSLDRVRGALAARLGAQLGASAEVDVVTWVRDALPDGVLLGLLADAGTIGAPEGAVLAGRLGTISTSDVLHWLAERNQTGRLRILGEGARVDLFFRKGYIDFAAAVGVAEEFLLGRFAVEGGDLTPAMLETVLAERARAIGKPPLFGRDLIARELLTEDQLKAAMRRQTAELVYETLRWTSGNFEFLGMTDLPELAEEAALAISVDTLLLEGFRRVDEWRLIERDIHSSDLIFVREEDRIAALPRGTLTRDEIAVLDALGGKHSVRDVVRILRMGSFDVSKVLYRLLNTKLIRQRVQPGVAI